MFAGTISPNDIKQGQLGDCYFLSAISTLAQYPDTIKNIFKESCVINEEGKYQLCLNKDGIPTNIVVDDFLPCKFGKPIFTKGQGNELWVLLLEKAYAKMHGSYQRIENGSSDVAMRDLTGAPTKSMKVEGCSEKEVFDNIK